MVAQPVRKSDPLPKDGALVSPNRTRFAVGTVEGEVLLGDLQKKQLFEKTLKGHTAAVWSVSFTPDGTRVYSASDDGTIRCWKSKSGDSIGVPLLGHSNCIRSISISNDGKRVVSSSQGEAVRTWDKTVRIWDAQACSWDIDKSLAACGLRGSSRIPVSIPDDGWTRTPEGGHLLWIPKEYRIRVCDVSSNRISANEDEEPIRILWDELRHGERWSGIRNVVE